MQSEARESQNMGGGGLIHLAKDQEERRRKKREEDVPEKEEQRGGFFLRLTGWRGGRTSGLECSREVPFSALRSVILSRLGVFLTLS